ncbi:MAG: type II toxin-antitoxin system prevent-host-death family antitoxin [Acidobacteriota bacterium]|nr:type II toxin-antitoxin system prevent-host-death family antitoxin [Acidobacteriota bacterium]
MATNERRVGVRQLRQNLSVYLRRVDAGETLEVTERGRPVALLTPAPARTSVIRRLVSSGRASAPAGELLDLGAPPKSRKVRRGAAARALDRERDERL